MTTSISATAFGGLDFSNSEELYRGSKTSLDSKISASGTYNGVRLSISMDYEKEEGEDLRLVSGSNYRLHESTRSYLNGEPDSDSTATVYDLSVDSRVVYMKKSFFSDSSTYYPAGMPLAELVHEDTKFYRNGDNVLTIIGTVETSMDTEIGAFSYSYDYTYQYHSSGLLLYAEFTNMKSLTSSFSLSGFMTMSGEVGGSVDHIQYASEI